MKSLFISRACTANSQNFAEKRDKGGPKNHFKQIFMKIILTGL